VYIDSTIVDSFALDSKYCTLIMLKQFNIVRINLHYRDTSLYWENKSISLNYLQVDYILYYIGATAIYMVNYMRPISKSLFIQRDRAAPKTNHIPDTHDNISDQSHSRYTWQHQTSFSEWQNKLIWDPKLTIINIWMKIAFRSQIFRLLNDNGPLNW
jgi:hypothetical protein